MLIVLVVCLYSKAGLANYTFTDDLLQTMQRLLDDQPQVGPAAGIRVMEEMKGTAEEPFELLPHLKLMEKCFVQPTVPDIMEALAEEAPTSEWARLQLEKLKKKNARIYSKCVRINRIMKKIVDFLFLQIIS